MFMLTRKSSATPRRKISQKIETTLLLANRHACCVCQKSRIQIHHIDSNPGNNDLENLATLCTDHHDMASMQIGLTKKLQPDQVREYKRAWEGRCAADLLALARERQTYFVTLYKNPPRVRELFTGLLPNQMVKAVEIFVADISEDEPRKKAEGGFGFQSIPRKNQTTLLCLASAAQGELWPQWLPRVPGHPEDPDLPVDLSPPHGMQAFHHFDLYIQILARVITLSSPPIPLEDLYELNDEDALNAVAGSLVSFRERSYAKNVESPRSAQDQPVGRIEFRRKRGKIKHLAELPIRNMYVFSDTAAENLRNTRVCGIGVFGGAVSDTSAGNTTFRLRIVPLLIGMGGFGQSDASGWSWNIK